MDIEDCAFGVADRCGGSPFQEGDQRVCSNYRVITLLRGGPLGADEQSPAAS